MHRYARPSKRKQKRTSGRDHTRNNHGIKEPEEISKNAEARPRQTRLITLDKQGREIHDQDDIIERIEEFYMELYDSEPYHPIPSDPIRSDPIRSDPIRSDPIRSDPIRSDPIRSDPIRSDPIRSDPIPSDPIPSDPIRSHPIPSDPIRSDPIRSHPIPSHTPYTIHHTPYTIHHTPYTIHHTIIHTDPKQVAEITSWEVEVAMSDMSLTNGTAICNNHKL